MNTFDDNESVYDISRDKHTLSYKHKLELKYHFGDNPLMVIRYRDHIVDQLKAGGFLNGTDYEIFGGYGTINLVSNKEAPMLFAKLLF